MTWKVLDIAQLQEEYNKSRPWYRHFLKPANLFEYNVIRDGYLGVRALKREGRSVLLPPGIHFQYPFESIRSKRDPSDERYNTHNLIDLSKKTDTAHPFTSFRVDEDEVAITLDKGQVNVFNQGHYILTSSTHTLDSFMSLKEKTFRIRSLELHSHDQLPVVVGCFINYKITDAIQAYKSGNVTSLIKSQVSTSLAAIINQYSFNGLVPSQKKKIDFFEINEEVIGKSTEILAEKGIALTKFGITRFSTPDEKIAFEVAGKSIRIGNIATELETAESREAVSSNNAYIEVKRLGILSEGVNTASQQIKNNSAMPLVAHNANINIAKELAQGKNPCAFFTSPVANDSSQCRSDQENVFKSVLQ